MKVSITAESKRYITLEEAPIVKAIIDSLKEDETTAAEYVTYAINAACKGTCQEVFKVKATIAKNCRANNSIIENSKDLDVRIEATAQITEGFCIIEVYLSDILQLSEDNRECLVEHMYVRTFTEKSA